MERLKLKLLKPNITGDMLDGVIWGNINEVWRKLCFFGAVC
jgi:hypothetical protein